jgi:hypothetical protein
MSYPARGPCKGIDGKANGFRAPTLPSAIATERSGGEDMSYPARGPCKGIDGKANGFRTPTPPPLQFPPSVTEAKT